MKSPLKTNNEPEDRRGARQGTGFSSPVADRAPALEPQPDVLLREQWWGQDQPNCVTPDHTAPLRRESLRRRLRDLALGTPGLHVGPPGDIQREELRAVG